MCMYYVWFDGVGDQVIGGVIMQAVHRANAVQEVYKPFSEKKWVFSGSPGILFFLHVRRWFQNQPRPYII